jgi:hypothetical protein
MKMDEASRQFVCPDLPACRPHGEIQSPKMVIHLTLVPGQTVSWRVIADSEIRAYSSRVWLTRIFSPYDYWMEPGDVIRVTRGERIWLSADAQAEVTLTSEYVERRNGLRRWIARLQELAFYLTARRAE